MDEPTPSAADDPKTSTASDSFAAPGPDVIAPGEG